MEKLIYPPTVWSYNHLDENGQALPGHGEICREIPYDCYLDAVKNRKVGDTIAAFAGGPGVGRIVHKITPIDETGVYGVCIENTMRIMQAWEVK